MIWSDVVERMKMVRRARFELEILMKDGIVRERIGVLPVSVYLCAPQ